MQCINEWIAWVQFRFHTFPLTESHYFTCLFVIVSNQAYERQEISKLNKVLDPHFVKRSEIKKTLRNFKGKIHISHFIIHVCQALMVEEKMSVLLSLFVLFFPLRKNKENLKIWGAAEGDYFLWNTLNEYGKNPQCWKLYYCYTSVLPDAF